jgi:LysR family transcriptional regulator, nitrogen assimilation regulatory protein
MELRQLRYFVKIADMGSMSRASKALHISQPSLSHQMAQLEDELGKPLFTRIPSGVLMTAEGEAFYRQALQILRQIDDIRGVVDSAQLGGHVSIALVQTQAVQYALPLMVKVHELYPRIELEVFDDASSDALQGIASGRRDFGMLVNEEDAVLLETRPVVEEQLFLMSHPAHAPQGDVITLAEVVRLPLALPGPGQIPRALHDALDGGLGALAKERWIVANSIAIFRQAVLAGVAHAIQPWGVMRDEVATGRVRATPIGPGLVRKVHLSACRGTTMSQSAQAVRQVLLTVIAQEIACGHVRGRLLASDD